MRFEAEVLLKNPLINKSHIPFLLLEHLKEAGIDYLKDDGKPKDYCFAVKSIKKNRIIKAVFSFYNKDKGMEVMKSFLTETDILRCINIKTLREKEATGSFKICSPIVLYATDKKAYVSEDDTENFSKLAKINVKKLLNIIAGIEIKDEDIHIEPVALYTSKSYLYIPDKKGVISIYGLNGIIDIKADKKILDVISKIGIGRRRSLGYGLLEPI